VPRLEQHRAGVPRPEAGLRTPAPERYQRMSFVRVELFIPYYYLFIYFYFLVIDALTVIRSRVNVT
jgi:hypothetical protein